MERRGYLLSLKIKNNKGEWIVDQKAIQTSILDIEGNFESDNVEGALRELANKKARSSLELEMKSVITQLETRITELKLFIQSTL